MWNGFEERWKILLQFISEYGSEKIIRLDNVWPCHCHKGAIFMVYSVLSLNSLNLICMHRCLLEIQVKNFNYVPGNASRVRSVHCSTSIILANHEMP